MRTIKYQLVLSQDQSKQRLEEFTIFLSDFHFPRKPLFNLSRLDLITHDRFSSPPGSDQGPTRITADFLAPMKGKIITTTQRLVSHLEIHWSPQPHSAPPFKARHAALEIQI